MIKYEFASPQWLALFCGVISERTAHEIKTKPNLVSSSCEVLTNAPPQFADAEGKVAWSVVIRDGVVDFRCEERSDVAFKVIADYHAMVPIARYDTRGDPKRGAELVGLVDALVRSNRLRMIGERLVGPNTLSPLHDTMARFTA